MRDAGNSGQKLRQNSQEIASYSAAKFTGLCDIGHIFSFLRGLLFTVLPVSLRADIPRLRLSHAWEKFCVSAPDVVRADHVVGWSDGSAPFGRLTQCQVFISGSRRVLKGLRRPSTIFCAGPFRQSLLSGSPRCRAPPAQSFREPLCGSSAMPRQRATSRDRLRYVSPRKRHPRSHTRRRIDHLAMDRHLVGWTTLWRGGAGVTFLSPLRGSSILRRWRHPGLAPWAAFFRRFAAWVYASLPVERCQQSKIAVCSKI